MDHRPGGGTGTTAASGRMSRPALIRHVVAALGLGLLVSLMLARLDEFGPDVDGYRRFCNVAVHEGITRVYEREPACVYPPLYLYMLWLVGNAYRAVVPPMWDGTMYISALFQRAGLFFLKLPAILFDLGTGLVVFWFVRRWRGDRTALLALYLYVLNPVPIYNSAVWGQNDGIHSGLVALGVLGTAAGWPIIGIAAAAVAVTQKFQAVVYLPFVIAVAFRLSGRRVWLPLAGVVLGAALVSLVFLPFWIDGRFNRMLETSYQASTRTWQYTTMNAFNWWHITTPAATLPSDAHPPLVYTWLFGWPADQPAPPYFLKVPGTRLQLRWTTAKCTGLVLLALGCAITLLVTLWRKDPLRVVAGGVVLGLCFFMLPTQMHERYGQPVLPLLLALAAIRPELWLLFAAVTILQLLNLLAVMSPLPLAPVLALCFVGVFVWTILRVFNWDRSHFVQRLAAGLAPVPLILAVVPPLVAVQGMWRTYRALAPDENTLYLHRIPPTEQRQRFGFLQIGRNVETLPLRMEGITYTNGFGVHAEARLVYPLPEGFRRFSAKVGIDDTQPDEADITVVVLADDREVFRGVHLKREPPMEIDVDVAGAKQLTLWMDNGPSGREQGDQVDWIEAKLTR